MARIVVMGAGIGGISQVYELQKKLGAAHDIVLIGDSGRFEFTPSNPWVAVGWRKPEQTTLNLPPLMQKHGIEFHSQGVRRLSPADNRLELNDGRHIEYDFLVIATGPKLAFEEVPGLGPDSGYTQSVCKTGHADASRADFEQLVANPGPVVIGAAAAASCFGPAYEYAFILDTELKKRKIRDRVPMHFITPEPYVGHLGLDGVGDTKSLMESELRDRHIKWTCNAKITEVNDGTVRFTEFDESGQEKKRHELPFRHSMILPAFKGVDAVDGIDGLTNPRGFILIDEFQRNPAYPNIYAVGVCVAIPPVSATPVPTGAPKTGYMIESMVTATTHNISRALESKEPDTRATWNAVCLADFGDSGVAFVALPQIPPRNTNWASRGKWVHLAKVAYEKYFLHKVRTAMTEPYFEKTVLKLLGATRLKDASR
ncbi:MAG: NAD(P)/FAD-dependent oxidoreductase [Gammaproteobacteria bacterium]|nr:NAD(P)/FAD-dependent oxidoreductase [Gammaproteobacteria bacterium]MDH4314731.1 NAD(P)/FAD-dependent oxidoreductase [Gammaproteobacteria bacterium]MDH5212749.1 NAD(P)/FAD-dependent oxidoreductase [Gammaproteobacteria bacterium]